MRSTTQHSKITLALISLTVLTACGGSREAPQPRPAAADVECMARAMYFESNRSSSNGMLAVGSVVMNRVESDRFPNTVCGVVSQPKQFAPGVMTKPMNKGANLARQIAQEVLSGQRHPKVSKAKFFHAAWYRANYNNMHYVVTAGGNAFYEKRRPEQVTNRRPFPEE
ncbi:cell wall hydrolase [Sulfitobacter maritimus]|uniref:cell wall hydrolase n=1 Tax=Sulfitobacter maritimus TaxID=2741719 RepID=UPI001FEB007B|nr:cell wall hydrolase [Sulfitobacter maritimus]